jgi:hypothetical protein
MNELDVREDMPWSQPRPRWRKRILIGSLIAVPLCLAAPFVYFLLSTDQALLEAIAEADRLDPCWRIPELEQKRAVIPDKENSWRSGQDRTPAQLAVLGLPASSGERDAL